MDYTVNTVDLHSKMILLSISHASNSSHFDGGPFCKVIVLYVYHPVDFPYHFAPLSEKHALDALYSGKTTPDDKLDMIQNLYLLTLRSCVFGEIRYSSSALW